MKRKITVAVLCVLSVPTCVFAQDGEPATTATGNQAFISAADIVDYWDEDRMANAVPVSLRRVETNPSTAVLSAIAGLPDDAYPTLMPGWDPDSGQEPPGPDAMLELDPDDALFHQLAGFAPASYGSPPSNPVDYANYGPYQRWTWYGRYTTWPTSTIGKLFFTQGGGNFVCSGTVINRNTIITAGHCVSDGAGTWSTNLLFCPSYNAGGVNPARGCWAYTGYIATTSDWHNSQDTDRDYACFVTQSTGTLVNNRIGNVAGWVGLAWNFPSTQMEMSTGYPAGAPFDGRRIIFDAATEWYTVNMDPSDANVSKYMGSDMTGGSSGGGWWLSIRHPSAEYPDVDGSGVTDPGAPFGPYVNGLNSHARCRVSCGTPPSASAGTFWSEIGSPQFTSSGSDARDVIDIVNLCNSNGGS